MFRKALFAMSLGLFSGDVQTLPTPTAPNIPVVFGKDGMLFYNEDLIDRSAPDTVPSIVAAVKAVEATGTKVVIAMVPTKASIYEDRLPAGQQMSWKGQTRYDGVMSQLKSAGVNVADLHSALLGYRALHPTEALYHLRDDHWLPLASTIAADEIARVVNQAADLKAVPRVNYSRTPTPSAHLGNLVRFLSAAQQAQLKPLPFTRYNYVAVNQSAGLLDDAAPEVALVGTSFSEPFTQLREALQYSLQHEVLDASLEGGAIWKPLPNFLKNQAYKDHHPKVIVWEFIEYRLWKGPPNNWLKSEILPYLK